MENALSIVFLTFYILFFRKSGSGFIHGSDLATVQGLARFFRSKKKYNLQWNKAKIY